MEALTNHTAIKEKFKQFIVDKDHPCVMAQTVFRFDTLEFHEYKDMGTLDTAKQILADLKNYIQNYTATPNKFYSFIAAFPGEKYMSELHFEKKLWQQLQALHDIDDQPWDPNVSTDPDSDQFSFSLNGKSFYIVGLHPGSSRLARQSPYPTLVFNLHHQFERLRKMEHYKKIRDKIRERDKALQGYINPMLEDFGNASEAKQYSGRKVEKTWKCPFHH